VRIYRRWAGNEKGTREDITRCIASVADTGRSCLFHQCARSRGKGPDGLYCGIHARKIASGVYVSVPDDEAPVQVPDNAEAK
jgi:hypothetical protein